MTYNFDLDTCFPWGPFQYFLVTLMTCSCLAAIMSTADSALMGASSIVSLDIFKGTLFPSMSKKNVVRFGELTSVVICSLAFFLGMFLSDDQMGVIIIFQNGMLMQLLPAFGFGLFWPICERPVCSGIVAGLVSLIILTITGNPLDGYVPAVNVSVFVNFLTVALMCVFAPGPSREKEEQLDVPQIRTSVTNPPPWRSGKTGKSWILPQIYIQISQKPDGFFKWIFHGLDDRWW